ncbi:MAG TPA: hypothetical protein VMZ53_33080 [Kofleriaceae bacterium]|nr:hypothetical protein [Kofleriaceae bacterium]
MRHVLPLVIVAIAAVTMFIVFVRARPAPQHVGAKAPPVVVAPHAAQPLEQPVVSPISPRLLESGFEGMSTAEMASLDKVISAFPHFHPWLGDSRIGINGGFDVVATIYFDESRGAYKVAVEKPGILTVHGLEVGRPLAEVLDLHVRHQCETISSILSSLGPVYRAIRCWVGKEPARFRYVATLPDEPFGDLAAFEANTDRAEVPAGGAALEQWIRTSGVQIDQILWRNDLEVER